MPRIEAKITRRPGAPPRRRPGAHREASSDRGQRPPRRAATGRQVPL